MKERGKAVETYRNISDFNCCASEIPCKKHPYSSHVGICPYCLKDRLVKLVCSECGKHRISSCSCSDIFTSNRNSCSIMDVGSVGRISFLIDNEKIDNQQRNPHSKSSKRKDDKSEKIIFLRRSSSSCVESKKKNGFWRIKKLFRKKRNKGHGENGEFCDENSEMCASDIIGVSRSRSLRSFRGGKNNDFDEGSDYSLSNAKISDVSSGIFFDSDKQFSRSVFPIKESDFSAMDDSAFIDLKLDSLSGFKPDFSATGINGASDHAIGLKNGNLASLKGNGVCGNAGSCRITMDERGLKQGSRNYRVWKWIFKNHKEEKSDILKY